MVLILGWMLGGRFVVVGSVVMLFRCVWNSVVVRSLKGVFVEVRKVEVLLNVCV